MLTQVRGVAPAFAPTQSDPRPHAVVIGSGFGGLAAAVRLGARGYRVTRAGAARRAGRARPGHRQDGFTFDAGPTIITAPFLFEELWALCGRRLADDVELRAGRRRSTASASTTAPCSTTPAMPAAMRAEVARLARRRRRLRALHAPRAKRSSASASSNSATCRSIRGPTWRAACPTSCGCRAGAASTRSSAAMCATRGCASCSASIRC